MLGKRRNGSSGRSVLRLRIVPEGAALGLAAVLLLAAATLVRGAGVVTIDLSYKVVLNPADGTRPPGPLALGPVTDAEIDAAVAEMNDLYASYYRGYRFRRVGAITNVGGMGDTTGPSQWYDTDFFANDGGTRKDQMEAAAKASKATYAWSDTAINLYLTNGICGGICSFAGEGDEIVIIGGCSSNDGSLQLHEIGHYYELCHTQGCPCASCDPNDVGVCDTIPGNDGISDTLPDLECWAQDDIANNSFGLPYASLSIANQMLVDDSFFNVMSYHSNARRLTELQLDRWADQSNSARSAVADGKTIFVEAGVPCCSTPGCANGSSTDPYGCLSDAFGAAASGDILTLRPGMYTVNPMLAAPTTLHGTRQGSAFVGVAPAPLEASAPRAVVRHVPRAAGKDPAARLGFAGEDAGE